MTPMQMKQLAALEEKATRMSGIRVEMRFVPRWWGGEASKRTPAQLGYALSTLCDWPGLKLVRVTLELVNGIRVTAVVPADVHLSAVEKQRGEILAELDRLTLDEVRRRMREDLK